jgi:selenide,water dikinase
MLTHTNEYLLTEYAHGAGCGCKIDPKVLKDILGDQPQLTLYPNLLVGNHSNDDAAVYDLGDNRALISTTDFFTPIVNDAYDFGRIAAANAISDVYAMGGRPIMALAILGWPVNKLPAALAKNVLDGARHMCDSVGIPLAGGHSIDSSEPIFGLSVNGLLEHQHLKKNNAAKVGDYLFMTKAIGTGVFSTAQKRKLLKPEHYQAFLTQLCHINTFGAILGEQSYVHALTDITGFGLLGHLHEMTAGSGLSVEVSYAAIPKMPALPFYLSQNCIPDATYRNWNAYSHVLAIDPEVDAMQSFQLLPDPQTNGGLLFSVDAADLADMRELMQNNGLGEFCEPIGQFIPPGEKAIRVKK